MDILEYIKQELEKPFKIDETDCCHTCNRWIFLKTGISLIDNFHYKNEQEAIEIMKNQGGLIKILLKAFKNFKIVVSPEPGDVGLIMFDDKVSPAIFTGSSWFTRHKDGFVDQKDPKVLRIWKIG